MQTLIAIFSLMLFAWGVWIAFTVGKPYERDQYSDECIKDFRKKRNEQNETNA